MDQRLAETGLRAAALRGDADAWRALYERAEADLARYALWRCGRHDLAEDVVQAAWLAAARGLKKFDPARGSFRTWLFNLAADAAGKQLRSRVRSTKRMLVLASRQPAETESVDAERVAMALAALTSDHEAVLRAKYFDGKSVEQIAEENRETPKAVESRLARARESFRRAYEPEPT
jgi:RNA polymerase sigma-70 factor (ECF subfamily)